jgi:hypothetical protein
VPTLDGQFHCLFNQIFQVEFLNPWIYSQWTYIVKPILQEIYGERINKYERDERHPTSPFETNL